MTPDEYCQQKAARSGSSFYYSFMFLPPEQRRAITALYAFCREVDDMVDEVADPAVARAKLDWWRAELRATFAGSPQHPVTSALAPHLERFGIDAARLNEIVDGMQMDLEQNRYLDFEGLRLYCHRVAGVVGTLSAGIFGRSPATARPTPSRSAWRCSSPTSSATSATTRGAAASTCRSRTCSVTASRRADILKCAPRRRFPGADALPGRARARASTARPSPRCRAHETARAAPRAW